MDIDGNTILLINTQIIKTLLFASSAHFCNGLNKQFNYRNQFSTKVCQNR